MGAHDDIETTAAEYFATHAGIALSEVCGDAEGLERLRSAAVAFLASLPVAGGRTLDPFVIVEGGLVQNDPALPVLDLDVFDCGSDDALAVEEMRNLRETAATFPEYGWPRDIVVRCDEWLSTAPDASDVSPLSTVAQWATS